MINPAEIIEKDHIIKLYNLEDDQIQNLNVLDNIAKRKNQFYNTRRYYWIATSVILATVTLFVFWLFFGIDYSGSNGFLSVVSIILSIALLAALYFPVARYLLENEYCAEIPYLNEYYELTPRYVYDVQNIKKSAIATLIELEQDEGFLWRFINLIDTGKFENKEEFINLMVLSETGMVTSIREVELIDKYRQLLLAIQKSVRNLYSTWGIEKIKKRALPRLPDPHFAEPKSLQINESAKVLEDIISRYEREM